MLENEVGGGATTKPADVAAAMKSLLMEYNAKSQNRKSLLMMCWIFMSDLKRFIRSKMVMAVSED